MALSTHFENEHALENAEVMLDACREEYASAGRHDAAQALWGLDVKSPASAQLALLTVKNLPEDSDEGVNAARRVTIAALEAAQRTLTQHTLRRAS